MEENLYCEFFVNSPHGHYEFAKQLASICNTNLDINGIDTPTLSIYVDDNDDANPELAKRSDDGFLYYPHRLEIDPGEDKKDYKRSLKELIWQLRNIGYTVVPACDFEDYLNAPLDE